MSMTLSTLHFKTPSKLIPLKNPPRVLQSNHQLPFGFSPLTRTAKPLTKLHIAHNFHGPFKNTFNGFSSKSFGFIVKAQNGSDSIYDKEKDEMEARGQSSMPERFRYLTKEAPDKPVTWPWLIVLAFMLYAWRTVLWELSNWRRTISALGRFLIYISKFLLALVFHFIGNPITSLLHVIETTFYTVRSFYSSIIAYAPIKDLMLIIILTSAVLSIAEATVPDSVNSQPYLLTVAGLIGFAAVTNYITELFFWTLLLGLFGYARLVKKRDYISSALPPAAVLSAVGEPWVRFIAIGSFLGLAILQRTSKGVESRGDEDSGAIDRVPIPLLFAALAIGVRVAAKWAGYRHLTWMIA